MPKFVKQYKDKERCLKIRNRQRKRYYAKSRKGAINSHKKWSDNELALLYNKTYTDTKLSEIIGRSVQAIQIQRSKTPKNAR